MPGGAQLFQVYCLLPPAPGRCLGTACLKSGKEAKIGYPTKGFKGAVAPCLPFTASRAFQVFGYCMFKGGEEAKVGYPTEGFEGDVAGRSFHNGRFVQRLRQAAAGAPGVTLRQGTVRRLLAGARTLPRPAAVWVPLQATAYCQLERNISTAMHRLAGARSTAKH